MGVFDDGTNDRDGADYADAGADPGSVPRIRGGLLDPSTFPAYLSQNEAVPDGPFVQSQAPAFSGPLDTDLHAEVLRDIQKAQAKLPPIAQPNGGAAGPWAQAPQITGPLMTDAHAEVLQDILNAQAKLPPIGGAVGPRPVGLSGLQPDTGPAGLRHIDPYPGMNYAPPGRFAAPSHMDMVNFALSLPIPKEAYGPHITFINDEPRNPSPDRPVTRATAAMVEHAVVNSGVGSVNVNSTTGAHQLPSRHAQARAVDINRINDQRVSPLNPWSRPLQDAFLREKNIHEDFGPGYQVANRPWGGVLVPDYAVREGHQNHDHFSGLD